MVWSWQQAPPGRAPSAPYGGGRATTFCGPEKQHILHMQLQLLQR
jgi:hypothetical protein